MAKKKATKKAASIKKGTTSANKNKPTARINKSQAIREYHAKNPKDGPTAVAVALKAKGIDVPPSQVSNVLSASKKKVGKSSRVKKTGRRASNEQVNLSDLVAAQKFIDQVGDADVAKQLIGAIEKLK